MATETTQATQPKQPIKQGKDEPLIEVKEATAEAVKAAEEAKAQEEAKHREAQHHDQHSRVGRAEAIIRRNTIWSLGASVLPIPLLDLVAVTGVQVKMLSELSSLYGMTFREDAAKKVIGTLLSSCVGVGIGAVLGASMAKVIPTVGAAIGIVTLPVVAGAFTYATGRVFLMHFESGGTFLDFDPVAVRSHFKQEFEKAKQTVAQVQEEEKAKAAKVS